jgi:hypothetical protein
MNFLKYLNFPVIFSGAVYIPPATPLNFVPWILVCFIFTIESVGVTSASGPSTIVS